MNLLGWLPTIGTADNPDGDWWLGATVASQSGRTLACAARSGETARGKCYEGTKDLEVLRPFTIVSCSLDPSEKEYCGIGFSAAFAKVRWAIRASAASVHGLFVLRQQKNDVLYTGGPACNGNAGRVYYHVPNSLKSRNRSLHLCDPLTHWSLCLHRLRLSERQRSEWFLLLVRNSDGSQRNAGCIQNVHHRNHWPGILITRNATRIKIQTNPMKITWFKSVAINVLLKFPAVQLPKGQWLVTIKSWWLQIIIIHLNLNVGLNK